MADSSMNEPPEKKARIESSKDATTDNGSDLVDSTTKIDPGTKKTVPLVDLVSDRDPEADKTVESDDDDDDEEDADPEMEKTVESDDEESDAKTDEIGSSQDVVPSSDKSTPDDDGVDKTEEEKSDNPEDVFDDSYTRSSDEEDENDESKEDKKKEIPLEPFNMEEEKEMGSFDKDFNFTWKTKSREPTDAWLANEGAKPLDKDFKRPAEEPDKQEETPTPTLEEFRELLSDIVFFMRNNETVQFAITRMSNPVAASASARLALKKAGGSYQVSDTKTKSAEFHALLSFVTKLPVCAEVYTLTRREILDMLESEEKLIKFRNKSYPPLQIDITSGTDSEEEAEGLTTRKAKKPVLVTLSSSDEEEEGDDEDKDRESKPNRTNGMEVDMFAE